MRLHSAVRRPRGSRLLRQKKRFHGSAFWLIRYGMEPVLEAGTLRGIFDTLPVAIFVIDDEKKEIVDANVAGGRLLGVAPERVRGRPCNDIFSGTRKAPSVPVRLPPPDVRAELFVTDASGTRIPTLISTNFLRSGGKRFKILTCVDITEQFEAQESISRSLEQLKIWLVQGEIRNREIFLLNELVQLLQSNRPMDEMVREAAARIAPLFPESSGAICLAADGSDAVRQVASWGSEETVPPEYPRGSCTALCTRALHVTGPEDPGEPCAHRPPKAEGDAVVLCAPMIMHEEVLGALHVLYRPETIRGLSGSGIGLDSLRKLAVAVASQTGLSLANLKLRDTLRQQAVRDPLTGIFNRRYLEETGRREIAQARRRGASIGIIMADVDHFKRFNDEFGHAAGDAVLKSLAGYLASHIRSGDIPARYGGEEFTLVLSGASSDGASIRAEALRRGVETLVIDFPGASLPRVTLSMGVAAYPRNGETLEELLEAADGALYEAKTRGRNCVVVAPPSAAR